MSIGCTISVIYAKIHGLYNCFTIDSGVLSASRAIESSPSSPSTEKESTSSTEEHVEQTESRGVITTQFVSLVDSIGATIGITHIVQFTTDVRATEEHELSRVSMEMEIVLQQTKQDELLKELQKQVNIINSNLMNVVQQMAQESSSLNKLARDEVALQQQIHLQNSHIRKIQKHMKMYSKRIENLFSKLLTTKEETSVEAILTPSVGSASFTSSAGQVAGSTIERQLKSAVGGTKGANTGNGNKARHTITFTSSNIH
ncbi:hypothetical protein NDU88_004694 [Pleurodeles waltl]|uniref:Uncharacterized protein n=1 Tax=Pleurodeles waltl TaxID=8319 RepID=A0AAV7RK96_PLEWA|nr:hypothetical protein NDU88_004694 [Pleurodeles waltl]